MSQRSWRVQFLVIVGGVLAASAGFAQDAPAAVGSAPSAVTPAAVEPVTSTAPAAAANAATRPEGMRLSREVRATENSQTLSDTIFSGDVIHGGYGGPVLKYSTVAGQSAWFFGGRGGWLINRRLTIGGGGFGMTNRVEAPLRAQDGIGVEDTLMFGYGGVMLSVHGRPTKLINGTLTLFGGGGGVTIWDEQIEGLRGSYGWKPARNDGVFVFEPELMVNLNVASFFRVGVGAGYRFVRDLHLDGVENKDFSGAVVSVMLKFGKFD